MNYAEYISNRFPKSSTLHNIIGKESIDGILESGFLRKNGPEDSDIDITFRHYGALLIIQGEGTYIDSDGTEIPIFPGCYVQRLPDRRHSTVIKPGSRWFETFVCFGRSLYHALENMGLIDASKPVMAPGLDNLLLKEFLDLYVEMEGYSLRNASFLLTKAQEIVFLAHKLDEAGKSGGNSDIIENACRIVDGSRGINETGTKIARDLNIGYETFRKLFKSSVGVSPNLYIIQRRINHAKSLLLDSEKSIKEIALDLGYPDQFSFSKQFKKVCGMNPTEFRGQF